MHCNKVSFQELLDCSDIVIKNTAWNFEHNAQLQESLNRAMQRIRNNNYLSHTQCKDVISQYKFLL